MIEIVIRYGDKAILSRRLYESSMRELQAP